MNIYSIEEDNLIPYKERDFRENYIEENLEIWLENNSYCLLEDEKLLIIGRQVSTNLNSVIDLLGIDKKGNVVVVELKRNRTPRETIAQILEYTSYIEDLSYQQLEKILMNYIGEEGINLTEYHRNYYELEEDEAIAFNKEQKLLIIAQTISKNIKQTATYLRKNGIKFYCLEFKYFEGKENESLISLDFVVGKEDDSIRQVSSDSLPEVDYQTFMDSLNDNGKDFFGKILEFAEKNDLKINWGSKGFSLNVNLEEEEIGIIYGYPPNSVFGQTVYLPFDQIEKKVNDGEDISEYYWEEIKSEFEGFKKTSSRAKFYINNLMSNEDKDKILEIIKEIIGMIEKAGIKS